MCAKAEHAKIIDRGNLELQPVEFDSLKGWRTDDHFAALEAFKAAMKKFALELNNWGSLQVETSTISRFIRQAKSLKDTEGDQARLYFEDNFQPCRILSADGGEGFVTGYYEPKLAASPVKTSRFCVPLYHRPPELIDLDDQNRPSVMDPSFFYGHSVDGCVEEYFDRAAIHGGALEGRGLELAWLDSKTDAYFVHVQGSACLEYPDGQIVRVGFAAKSGHPYTSLGKVLCDRTNVQPQDMTADRLARWMRENPHEIDELMAQNSSFIFFRLRRGGTDDGGPVGAAGVPLIAGRSLAIDHRFHPYGMPLFVESSHDLLETGTSFARLMIAHDTGSAIVGPKRGDIFVGSGDHSGRIAGRIRHAADMTLLVPKQ